MRPYGLDVNSGVAFPNGDKDPDRLRDFIRLAKSCTRATECGPIVHE